MIGILRKIRSIMRRIIDFILPGEISESKYSFF